MSTPPEKFYLTTPIYYVNARPHIGHAYTTIVADVVARRHRLLGHDTWFLTGTDEHGQKIERSAAAAGIPPQQFADQVSKSFRSLWKRMGLTNDAFIRTTDPRHKQGVQQLFRTLYDRGQIYLSSYTGQYCVSEEMFIEGPPGTLGPDGRPTETVTEENYFFRLSDYQRPLLDLIESGNLTITPEARRNEVLSFLRGNVNDGLFDAIFHREGVKVDTLAEALERGYVARSSPSEEFPEGMLYVPGALKDLSVSRSSFTWGIPVPDLGPNAPKPAGNHVIYVWLDALANYMTAIGYGSDSPADQARFNHYWPADLHIIGKEISRFHCVYWPAFLLALNPAPNATNKPSSRDAVILSEAKDPCSSPNAATMPGAPHLAPAMWERNAPSTPQSNTGGNVSRPLTFDPAWAAKMLPKAITAHGWLLFEESKMSKSRGNIVRTETILDAFGTLCPPHPQSAAPPPEASNTPAAEPALSAAQTSSAEPALSAEPVPAAEPAPLLSSFAEGGGSASALPSFAEGEGSASQSTNPAKHDQDLFASDILRYFLLREIPFGQDGSFSFDAMITRYNADLANGYGNLVSRTLNLIVQNFSRTENNGGGPSFLPPLSIGNDDFARGYSPSVAGVAGALITALLANRDRAASTPFQTELQKVAEFVQRVDVFINDEKPWKLVSEARSSIDRVYPTPDSQALAENEVAGLWRRIEAVLYTAAESIRILTALLYPILPYATARVWAQLGLGSIEEAAARGDLRNLEWGGLKPGTRLGPLAPIFPRADKGLAQIMTDMETKPSLTAVTADNDAATSEETEFREAPISDFIAPATTPGAPGLDSETWVDAAQPSSQAARAVSLSEKAERRPGAPSMTQSHRDMGGNVNPPSTPSHEPTSPSAPPRTSTLPHDNPGAQVGGSSAPGPELTKPPSHTQTPGSGLFAGTAAPPQITIDDFVKIELRVARILVAERIPKADKLLRLEVDLGPAIGQRQILSGIAEWYTPEDLIGRKIVVITNLAPRKMRGLESHGMLLAASHGENGKPVLATFAEEIEVGARLK